MHTAFYASVVILKSKVVLSNLEALFMTRDFNQQFQEVGWRN